ncbi:unnamed protein product, partial [Heterotrigona itama]
MKSKDERDSDCRIFPPAVELNVQTNTIVLEISYHSTRPNIISRSDWAARRPSSVRNLAQDPAPFVLIHHSDSDSCTTQAICQAKNYHMDNKSWEDIGYNFLIGEDGNIYEGRGWSKHGSHSRPYNSKSIGICMIGNFNHHNPNAAAIKAVQDLIEYGVSLGKIQENYKLFGHRQTTQTTCPGDSLYQLIQTWPHWSVPRVEFSVRILHLILGYIILSRMVSLSRGPWRPSQIPHVHQDNPTAKCAINNRELIHSSVLLKTYLQSP